MMGLWKRMKTCRHFFIPISGRKYFAFCFCHYVFTVLTGQTFSSSFFNALLVLSLIIFCRMFIRSRQFNSLAFLYVVLLDFIYLFIFNFQL